MTRKNRRTMDFIETLKDGDEIKLADAIAWADKTLIEKACEYAQSKYDLDYCGDVKDVLDYLKSLVEE